MGQVNTHEALSKSFKMDLVNNLLFYKLKKKSSIITLNKNNDIDFRSSANILILINNESNFCILKFDNFRFFFFIKEFIERSIWIF